MTAGRTTPRRLHPPSNPYVGPFPFSGEQRLPNREREAQELADLVVSERVVLLHAPSGAGKTSLIQAAVLPKLTAFSIAGPARVNKPVPLDEHGAPRPGRNRYVRSIALSLLDSRQHDPAELDRYTLMEVLQQALPPASPGHLPLLVLDQFEEVLTLDPTDWPVKKQFFQDLGAFVSKGGGWLLLAMREDYMGGLDRYLRHVPGHLRSRYRLDFLTHKEAREAIQKPALDNGVTVTDEAADLLLDKLARTKVEDPHGRESKRSPYVEPFQLQVVCRSLWKDAGRAHTDFRSIEAADVRPVNVEHALGRYFDDSITEIVQESGIDERRLRDWFDDDLITAQGFRRQTSTGPFAGGQDALVLGRLSEMFLINSDARDTTVWHELAHDRLIRAVLDRNRAWRTIHLEPWQNRALEWLHSNRPKELLLPPELLLGAASRKTGLTGFEREFLQASEDQAGTRFRMQRYKATSTVLALIAVLELAVIVILLLTRQG